MTATEHVWRPVGGDVDAQVNRSHMMKFSLGDYGNDLSKGRSRSEIMTRGGEQL